MPCAIARTREVLAGAERVAGLVAEGRRRARSCSRGRGARALHARVHVRLVVVTDVEHVVVSLEHAREAPEADVHRAAVAPLREDAHVAPLHAEGRGDSARHGGRVAEERVQPGHLPRGLGIRRAEHLQATGRVHGDEAAIRRAHRSVEDVARAERLAAPLAGAVPARQRVAAIDRRLHGALRRIEEAVADGEGARLVELRRCCSPLIDAPPLRARARRAVSIEIEEVQAVPASPSRACSIALRIDARVMARPPRPATTV